MYLFGYRLQAALVLLLVLQYFCISSSEVSLPTVTFMHWIPIITGSVDQWV